MSKNKNCYSCAYRKKVTGSAHSECHFDWLKNDVHTPSAKAHGKQMGWYEFPINFDPVWQTEECQAWSEEATTERNPMETYLMIQILKAQLK